MPLVPKTRRPNVGQLEYRSADRAYIMQRTIVTLEIRFIWPAVDSGQQRSALLGSDRSGRGH